jgi:hypothetical protein
LHTHFVLIDYENVQPESLADLDAENFKVLLFVGAGQTRLAFEVVAAMQKLGERAEYVKIVGTGSNALDFHIAFYIGHLSALDATAFFHIVSKDTGFDPLIQHLKTKRVAVVRSPTIQAIRSLKTANSKALPEKIAVVAANLKQRGASKPRTLKTLSSTISSLFQNQLSMEELAELIDELQRQGLVQVNDNKISYEVRVSDS